MKCERVRPLLQDLADGSLAPTRAVRAHLEECAGCGEDLTALRVLVDGLESLRFVAADPPDALVPRILASARRERARKAVLRLRVDAGVRRRATAVGAAAVGATAVAAAAVTVLRRRRGRRRRSVGTRGAVASAALPGGAAVPA